MSVKRATTTRDLSGDAGGPPAVGDTPTVPVGEPQLAANLTGDGPVEPTDTPVAFVTAFGTRVTVSSDVAHKFEELGYKPSK